MERIRRALERAKSERVVALRERPAPPAPVPRRTLRRVATDPGAIRDASLLLPGASGPLSQAFHELGAQVQQRIERNRSQALAVTSAGPRDGRTFVAINLAIAVAASGSRPALLVDFDLHEPRVHQRFGFVPAVGVDDCLQGDTDPDDALVCPEGYPGLELLPARSAVEDASKLFESGRARGLFDAIDRLARTRLVVFDLPPLLDRPDALALAQRAGAVLFVIADDQSRRTDVSRSLELLRDVPVVGTVLNCCRDPARAVGAG